MKRQQMKSVSRSNTLHSRLQCIIGLAQNRLALVQTCFIFSHTSYEYICLQKFTFIHPWYLFS